MDWFNSEYYHILYRNRDNKEAETFINNIIKKLDLKIGLKVLDLACGKGRHSTYLEKLGFIVTGIDKSINNIIKARENENENLNFLNKEMIDDLDGKYDAIFNLFTSFGYIDEDYNLKTINNINNHLKDDGYLIIDYLNSILAEHNLIEKEKKLINNINFKITRVSDNNFIRKTITFTDKKNYKFNEKVMKLSLDDFKSYFEKYNLEIVNCFGNYQLDAFDVKNSERLIMVIKKSQPKKTGIRGRQ